MKISIVNKSIVAALAFASLSVIADDSAPYNYLKEGQDLPFQAALAEVKLTSPGGSTILASGTDFDGYMTENFMVRVIKVICKSSTKVIVVHVQSSVT